MVALLVAAIPWAVGAARGLLGWARKRRTVSSGDDLGPVALDAPTIAGLDAQAAEALAATGVAPVAPIAIAPASVDAAADAFRSITPGIPDAVLRNFLAQTHLESDFGSGFGSGCWNMGAEQCPGDQPGDDYTCIDHQDTHKDGSTYTTGYKCFSSQQAAAAGYLRLLASDHYADAYASAQRGDVLGFVNGLFHGGWFEGVGATPEIRCGKYLAGVLARLPAIDAALADDAQARVAGLGPAIALGAGALALAAGGYGAWRALHAPAAPAGAGAPSASSSSPSALALTAGGSARPLLRTNQGTWSAPPLRTKQGTAPTAPAPAGAARARGGGRRAGGAGGGAGGRPTAATPPDAAPAGTPGGTWTPQQRADDQAAWDQATKDAEAKYGTGPTPGADTSDDQAQQLDQGDQGGDNALPPGFTPPPGADAQHGLETLPGEHTDDVTQGIADANATGSGDESTATASGEETSTGGETSTGDETAQDADARVAGTSDSMDGLMLAAVRAGEALNMDAWVEVEVEALDLVITVPRRAFRAHVEGYPDPLLLGVSYADQVTMCREMGWISMTWEMVDAVWRAAFTWRIEPVGQWVPGGDIGSLAFAERHTAAVDAAVAQLDQGRGPPADAVVRAEGKAWILHERLPTSAGAVLWGWQRLNGTPLQGFGYRHNDRYDDYSMCEPPAQRWARVRSNGEPIDLLAFYRSHFADPAMAPFLDAYEAT